MGIFKSLFGSNSKTPESEKNTEKVSDSKRGYVSAGGLYPDELAMLALAEKFKTEETNYPDYLRSKFFIGFPSSTLNSLLSRGFLRMSTPSEMLSTLKLSDLKKIASEHGLKVSGSKEELCGRISSSLDESEYADAVHVKYWKLTDKGYNELAANPYITYMTAKHLYSLENHGINIVTLNSIIHNLPKYSIRDIVWSEMNKARIIEYKQAIKERNFQQYANLLYTATLFLKEESKFRNALNSYFDYIFYRENFVAGANGIILGSSKSNLSIDFYVYAELMPYELDIISELTEKNGLDEKSLRELMNNNFSAQQDSGVFSNKQLIDFVISEMNGRKKDSQEICLDVEKNIRRILKKGHF